MTPFVITSLCRATLYFHIGDGVERRMTLEAKTGPLGSMAGGIATSAGDVVCRNGCRHKDGGWLSHARGGRTKRRNGIIFDASTFVKQTANCRSSALGIDRTSLVNSTRPSLQLLPSSLGLNPPRQVRPYFFEPTLHLLPLPIQLNDPLSLPLERLVPPDRLFHHPTRDRLTPTRLHLHLQKVWGDDLYFWMAVTVGETWVGVVGIAHKVPVDSEISGWR